MLKIEKTVFISYRRTNIGFALAIHQNLTMRGYDVFFDYESIKSGDFEQIILRSIESRAHFVVILTPSALERCAEPGDWLRREIEHALHHRRNIIPLTFEGFSFEDMNRYLPEHIAQPLSRYNGLRVPTDYFSEAMNRLMERLNIPLDAVLHPPTPAVRAEEERQRVAISDAAAVTNTQLTAQEYFERAYQHVEAKRYDEGIADYTEAIRLKPDYAEAYNNRGIAKDEKGDLVGAISDYTRSIALNNSELHLPYNNRGVTKNAQGDYTGAIADYNEAIRLKPDYPEAFYNRGVARTNLGDRDGAMSDYAEAIRLQPDHAQAYNNLGIAKGKEGDQDGAISAYTRSIELNNPELHLPYNNRGIARNAKGDYDGAISDHTEAIRLQPNYPQAYNNRGIARRNKGDYDGAISDYTEAIRLQPDYAGAYYNRGFVKYDRGDRDGAISDYTEAIRLQPDDATAYYNRGLARKSKGDLTGAISDYQAYLNLGGGEQYNDRAETEAIIRDLKKRLR